MTRLIAAALLAGTAIATPATAAPLFFDFVALNPPESFQFTLDSAPTPSSFGVFFTRVQVPVTTAAGTNASVATFFTQNFAGRFQVDGPKGVVASTSGPQIFSGTTANPMFSPGVFALTGLRPHSGGTLTISAATAAVPEPATWAMMIAGFGAVGYAMRRRQKVTARVSLV
jgi:hypothetical protein